MYLNIGGDFSVRSESVVGVFDLDSARRGAFRNRPCAGRTDTDRNRARRGRPDPGGIVMYLNIGGDFSVRSESVVGIFDLDNTSCSKWTRKFLAEAQRAGAIVEATDELPKSFLVVSEYGENRVILTKYNAAVLLKRMQDAQRTPISAKGEAI